MKTKGDKRTCKDCIYFDGESTPFQCCRFPPDKLGYYSQPEPDEWCGECTVDFNTEAKDAD